MKLYGEEVLRRIAPEGFAAFEGCGPWSGMEVVMERYMAHLLRGAQIRTRQFLDMQVRDKDSVQYGGIRGDIWEAKPTIYGLATAAAVWLNGDSELFHDRRLYEAMELGLDFVARTQREDGSFDYPSCNFKSGADTAFCFKRLFGAYRLLELYNEGDLPEIGSLKGKYLAVMRKALKFIRQGGFHTPNHRWGIGAALLQGAELCAGEEEFARSLRERAGPYLAEGIDGDEYGEYAERSTGNYNAVVNNAMMAMFEATGNEEFLGYVRRNLNMMLTYIDPDDTIFTQNSTRQDRGKQEFADKYFYQYLYLCSREDQPAFDGAAHKIIKDNMERGGLAPDCLHIVMAHKEMMSHRFTHYGFLDEYRSFYPNSGVLRVKRPGFTYTVMRGKTAFLYVKRGDLMVHVKLGESYCDIRNFVPEEITVEKRTETGPRTGSRLEKPEAKRQAAGATSEMSEKRQAAGATPEMVEKQQAAEPEMEVMRQAGEAQGKQTGEPAGYCCRLRAGADGWYYLPFKESPGTSDWWKMDHGKREKLINSHLDTEVVIDELDDGLELTIKADGLDRLPLRLEVCVPAGAVVEHSSFWLKAGAGEAMILRDGYVTVRDRGKGMVMGPGFGEHEFQGHYSGEEINAFGYTIYCNGYTPLEKHVQIRMTD